MEAPNNCFTWTKNIDLTDYNVCFSIKQRAIADAKLLFHAKKSSSETRGSGEKSPKNIM